MLTLMDYVGRTPVIKLKNVIDSKYATVWAKLENLNPAGSIKDRIALNILNTAENKGDIFPGETTIVEATSGNTGIALSMVCSLKGYKLKLFMPKNVSKERKEIVNAFGGEVIEVDDPANIDHAIQLAREFVDRSGGSAYMTGQFTNKNNESAHRLITAREIIDQIPGRIDALVVGVGTGGTITGVGNTLKREYGDIKIYAVEPAESPVLSGGKPGNHKIEGIGVGFVPDVLDTKIYDDVIRISSSEAKSFTNEIVRKEGILIGISSGATCLAARKVAEKLDTSANVVTIFFDSGERYLSTGLFSESD